MAPEPYLPVPGPAQEQSAADQAAAAGYLHIPEGRRDHTTLGGTSASTVSSKDKYE